MSVPFACTLASSSSGNATLFSNGRTHILLDAGIPIRAIASALALFSLSVYDLTAVVVTHEHGDHTAALPFLPQHIPVYASFGTAAHLPGSPHPVAPGNAFEINGVALTPFSTPHDTPDSTGYIVQDGAYRMALATDMGHMPDDVLVLLAEVPVLFLESNYDQGMLMLGKYPVYLKRRIAGSLGHLSNDACAEAAVTCVNGRLRSLVLMHLSKENNTPALAYDTTCKRLEQDGIVVGRDMQLLVAPRSEPCKPLSLYAVG